MPHVYLSLGSNIEPEKNLQDAATRLRREFHAIRFSSVFRTEAREVKEQPDFLNAVALFETDLAPKDILRKLKTIEKQLGKAPPFRFGPRTIDLDLLLYDDMVLEDPSLTLPHPRMHERRFVLEPLCQLIDPAQKHPAIKRTWRSLLDEVSLQKCSAIPLTL
jgi:2-amino-4-hydroxy-6-hydroxymethyldihydropteridine diphosphokinase